MWILTWTNNNRWKTGFYAVITWVVVWFMFFRGTSETLTTGKNNEFKDLQTADAKKALAFAKYQQDQLQICREEMQQREEEMKRIEKEAEKRIRAGINAGVAAERVALAAEKNILAKREALLSETKEALQTAKLAVEKAQLILEKSKEEFKKEYETFDPNRSALAKASEELKKNEKKMAIHEEIVKKLFELEEFDGAAALKLLDTKGNVKIALQTSIATQRRARYDAIKSLMAQVKTK